MSNVETRTILDILTEIAEEFCDHYCKYQEQYTGAAEAQLYNEFCNNCPIGRLL